MGTIGGYGWSIRYCVDTFAIDKRSPHTAIGQKFNHRRLACETPPHAIAFTAERQAVAQFRGQGFYDTGKPAATE